MVLLMSQAKLLGFVAWTFELSDLAAASFNPMLRQRQACRTGET
jgi:hypothetical protein